MVLALVYIAFAVWVVFSERTSPPGGGWISLSGMASYIVTIPVSLPMEMLGAKPDYQKTVDIGAAHPRLRGAGLLRRRRPRVARTPDVHAQYRRGSR